MAESLTIPQAFALLQIAPDGRRSTDAQRLDLGLAGAVLADLALRGSITLQRGLVATASGRVTGDATLDEVLGSIAACGAPRKAKWWVQRLGKRPLREAVLAGLVQRGVISEEQRTTLVLFTTTRHPELDAGPESLVRSGIADVLAQRAEPSAFLAALIGLLDATNTLRNQFGRVDKGLVRSIAEGEWASPAVRAVLSEIQSAAVVAGVIAATTAATTASS
ncbi:GPP34 family phosphoprotein [Curtobacterium sp. MCPF17_002]|uniref:GOLPH3/VPS74 family protein n=1 Tax=Curtobacterium sp. MCPF17_002 TaxID=2175645 RepID=UPI000DA6F38D|nr:GPP34 family phosphoprotein [Curtobacterium sp. MCPF17_002]WIB78791.1 GPP34 family phosphoprotein [Curtobacterium sp. MCPF17_002]